MVSRPSFSVAAFSIGQFLSLIAGLMLQVIVARRLLPADYGRFVIANTVLLALTLALVSAVPKALARVVSVDHRQIRRACRTILRLQLPICAAIALTLFACARLDVLATADRRLALALQCVAIELVIRAGLLEPAWAVLNGLHYHRTQAALMLMHSILRLVSVGIFLAFGAEMVGCLLALAIASMASLVIVSAVLARVCVQSVVQPESEFVTAEQLTDWIRLAPVAEILNYLVVASNLWFLKWMGDHSANIGLYAACLMLAQSAMPMGIAVSRGLFATFSAMFHGQQIAELSVLLRTVLRSLLIIAACAVAVAFVFGAAVVELFFGSDYRESGSLLGFLTIGTFGVALVWLLGDVLNAGEKLRTRFGLMVALGLCAAVSCTVLIPTSGVMGAAWALAGTGVVGAASFCIAVNWHVCGCVPMQTVARAVVGVMAAVWLCSGSSQSVTVGGILTGSLSAVGVCLAVLLLCQEWSRAERNWFQKEIRGLLHGHRTVLDEADASVALTNSDVRV